LPRNGVAGPPHFWPRGGRTGRMGVAEATPGLWGWSGHPKGQKKKKKNGKMCFGLWGWPDHPLGPGGGFGTPPSGRRGGFTPGPRRWSGHPKGQNPFFRFFFFFFFFGLSGWPDHPQRPTAGSATPWPKMGWSGHPISVQGVAPATPRFPLLLFFFFLETSDNFHHFDTPIPKNSQISQSSRFSHLVPFCRNLPIIPFTPKLLRPSTLL
jgi:hypothetical protein